ncbi:MAG: amino acid ABC transporter substrate-binding protein [Rhodobacteraceae bacterium]|nr:amino acid ABC transporter substrate-binding protein [Paracoccaceae bacterium]
MFKPIAILLAAYAVPLAGHAQDLTATLAHISETGTITLGVRTDQPPLSFVSGNGVPVGYTVEICNRIATDVGEVLGLSELTVDYVPVTADTRFDAIEDGTIDLLCGATTKTLGRAERVGFTQLTFATGGGFLSLEGNAIEGLRDARGKRVAVTEATTTIEALNDAAMRKEVAVEIVPVANVDAGFEALLDGSVDALAADQPVLIGKVLTHTGTAAEFVVSSELFSFEPYALALPRGDADFALLADRTISRLFRDGQVIPIYQRYFQQFGNRPPQALAAVWELMGTPE